MLGSENLTDTPGTQRITEPGMAYFAGSGPQGKHCRDCVFRGYVRPITDKYGIVLKTIKSGGCGKFHKLSGVHGPAISGRLQACKYFEAKAA